MAVMTLDPRGGEGGGGVEGDQAGRFDAEDTGEFGVRRVTCSKRSSSA